MSIQTEFLKFNERIRTDYSTNSQLASKRDILVKILRNSGRLPSFSVYDQGSYALFTGIEPSNEREYDIDVGLIFDRDTDDYNPLEIKKTIKDILKDHTNYGATIKKPCVTITYSKEGEPSYH